jgi:hypothetical protein
VDNCFAVSVGFTQAVCIWDAICQMYALVGFIVMLSSKTVSIVLNCSYEGRFRTSPKGASPPLNITEL